MGNDVDAQAPARAGRGDAPAIEVEGLSKSYGRTPVLAGLNLRLGWGEALSVLGPNGSGKTTLVRVLATLTAPDAGTVRVAGIDASRAGSLVRRAAGVVMHEPMLYADLTAGENLRFHCRMFGLDRPAERIAEAAARVGVEDRLGSRTGVLSHGMQKRVSIARALLHRPRVLLFDEPESGLDQSAVSLLRGVVRDAKAGGGAVLVVTHSFEQAMAMGDRVAILARGAVAHEGALGPGGAGGRELREAYFRHAGGPEP